MAARAPRLAEQIAYWRACITAFADAYAGRDGGPTLGAVWREDDLDVLGGRDFLPPDYCAFITRLGCLQAVGLGGGIAFLNPAQADRVMDEYAPEVTQCIHRAGDAVPIAANGGGAFVVMARNGRGIELVDVHFGGVHTRRLIAPDLPALLERLFAEWQALLTEGGGRPYLTEVR